MLSLEKVLLVKATEDEACSHQSRLLVRRARSGGSFEAVDGHTTPVFSMTRSDCPRWKRAEGCVWRSVPARARATRLRCLASARARGSVLTLVASQLSYATTPGAHMHFSELEWRRFVMQTFSDDPVSAA